MPVWFQLAAQVHHKMTYRKNVLSLLKTFAFWFGMPPHTALPALMTPNVKPCITDVDIEAQLQDDFTHEVARRCAPEPQRMDPNGAL
jgi:hypothetical protein